MHQPLISIIVPTFNRAHLIGETIDSILSQSYINWECIVIDDGSNDDTDEVLAEYCINDNRIKYFHRPSSHVKGANSCRNFGFQISKGQLINWFDSDDLMNDNFLSTSVYEFNKQKDLDFVLFDFCLFEGDPSNIINTIRNSTNNLIEDYATWKINFGTWAIVWRRSVVSEYRFDETLSRAQDLDFNMRVFMNGNLNYKNSNQIGVFLRSHPHNLTSDYNAMKLYSLKSEIKVRKWIIHELKELNSSELVIRKSSEILFMTFLKLYRGKFYGVFLLELLSFFKINSFKRFVWHLKIWGLTMVYALFGRGDLSLKKLICDK